MSSSSPDDGGRTAGAARVLRAAAAHGACPDNSAPLDQAIRTLVVAPPQAHWDRDLLSGLRIPSEHVVRATVDACLQRLEGNPDPQWQDRFVGDILDACFLFLAPQSAETDPILKSLTTRAEHAAANLFRAVCRHIDTQGLALDHHRARILARAGHIRQHGGSGVFVQVVLAYQRAIGQGGERSDQQTALKVHLARRDTAYASPITGEATLLGYLNQERDLPPVEIPTALLRQYATLLRVQTEKHAPDAIVHALGNLRHWLAQCVDLRGEDRDGLVGAVSAGATQRVAVPIESLPWQLRFHIEAHRALLPGPGRDDDLLVRLAERYNASESEAIFLAGLETLRHLPLVRTRLSELEALITSKSAVNRSERAWDACFDLIDSVLTGLADFVLTASVLKAKDELRNRLRRMLTEQDLSLRQLLQRIALEPARDLNLPRESTSQGHVRERAWRSLLRSLPPNLRELYWKGLHDDDGRLFQATIEEAGDAQQRVLWELLRRNWPEWLAAPGEEDEGPRRERLGLVIDYWSRTQIYDGVVNDGNDLGQILALALDDPDDAVRAQAELAIETAGFDLELARERQRRRLIELTDESTACRRRIGELEQARNEIGRQIDDTQLQKAERVHAIQVLQQARELIVTDGYITTARLQVANAELREALARGLAQAQDELGVIQELQRRIRDQARESARFYQRAEDLVGTQRAAEAEVDTCRRGIARANDELNQAERDHASTRQVLSHLERSKPREPYYSNDVEESARQQEAYRRDIDYWQSELNSAQHNLDHVAARIRHSQGEISSLKRQLSEAEALIARLQNEINKLRTAIAGIDARLRSLSTELRAGQVRWEELRERIAQLEHQVRQLEQEMERERRAARARIDDNTRRQHEEQAAHAGIADRLDQLSRQMTDTLSALQHQRTDAQKLIQEIDSGRVEYDNTGAEATRQSALSDANGYSREQETDLHVRSDQEALALYSHALGLVIAHNPPGPAEVGPHRPMQPRRQRSRE